MQQVQEKSRYANDQYKYRLKLDGPVQRVLSPLPKFFIVLLILVVSFALTIIILNISLNPTLHADSSNPPSIITASSSITQSLNSIEEQSAMGELKQLTASCRIKGAVIPEAKAKIYILPGQKYYDQTLLRPELGEHVFCSEKDAVSNGWTKSKA